MHGCSDEAWYEKSNATLQDSLAGIRIVQSFANEDIGRRKFHKGNEAFLISKRNNYRAMGTFQGGNTLFQGMMYLVKLSDEF